MGVLVGVSPVASVRWPEGEAPGDAPGEAPGPPVDPWPPPPPPPPPPGGGMGGMVTGGTQPVPSAWYPLNSASCARMISEVPVPLKTTVSPYVLLALFAVIVRPFPVMMSWTVPLALL